MASVLTPADPDYWDEFYIDGDGKGDVFEWYASYEVRTRWQQYLCFVFLV